MVNGGMARMNNLKGKITRILTLNQRNEYWDGLLTHGERYGGNPSSLLEIIQKHLERGDRILEIAGGYGRNARSLGEMGFHVTCTDVSGEAVKRAKKHYCHPNVTYETRDATNLDYRPNSFDVVLSIYGMNVFSKDEIAVVFRRANRILRPNGRLIANFLSRKDPGYAMGTKTGDDMIVMDDSQLESFFTKEEIKELYATNGFELISLREKSEQRTVGGKPIKSRFYLAIGKKAEKRRGILDE